VTVDGRGWRGLLLFVRANLRARSSRDLPAITSLNFAHTSLFRSSGSHVVSVVAATPEHRRAARAYFGHTTREASQ
jgi:hypothetical protein